LYEGVYFFDEIKMTSFATDRFPKILLYGQGWLHGHGGVLGFISGSFGGPVGEKMIVHVSPFHLKFSQFLNLNCYQP